MSTPVAEPVTRPRFYGPMCIARDFAASPRFYRYVLRLEGGGESPYAEFTAEKGSSLVLLDGAFWASVGGPSPPPASAEPRTGVVLAIKVPDVDAEHERLQREGVSLMSPPTDRPPMGLRNLLLLDPDGNVVELYSDLRRA
ncbi:MAG: VOC family protein [Thermoplasmata archaeon]|nr:VOC family protein [Thermoplasmata archaeon]